MTSLPGVIRQIRPSIAVGGVALLVAMILSHVLRNDLVWDDRIMLASGFPSDLASLPGMLAAPFWSPSGLAQADMPVYWRPLTTFVLWLGAAAGGHPWLYHLLSLLAAIFAAVSLFRLLRVLYPSDEALIPHIWLTLCYLAHPATAETICMVLNLSDHLALGFLLTALRMSMHQWRDNAPLRRLPIIALLIFAGCASKEFGITGAAVPLVSWLLVRKKEGRSSNSPFAIAAFAAAALLPVALFLFLRFRVLADVGVSGIPDIPFANLFLALGAALRQIVLVPVHGSVIPLFPHKPALWIISSVAVAAAAALWVWQQRRKPMTAVSFTGLSTGLALYLPSLLGATFESGDPFVATRYVHLVLLGLLISVAPLLQKPLTRRYQVVVGAIVISCLAFSYVRIREWRSEVSFFSAEHRAFPESHTVWHNLLNAQIKAGLYDDAILTIHDYTQRKQALTRTEESIRLHTLSRIALERDRNMVLATDLAHRALLDNPADLLLLFNLVEIRAAAGHPEESLIFLQRALSSSLYSPRQRQVIEMNLERLEQMMASRHNTSSGGTPSP